MTQSDPLALLARALDQVVAVMQRLDGANLGASTPCRSWDARMLSNHLVQDMDNFALAATGGRPDYRAVAAEVEGDRAAAVAAGAARLLAAWRGSGDLNRPMRLPFGEVPASFLVNQQIAEFAVHAWDLAVATDQKVRWDDEVAESALAWARTALRPEFRGDEASGMTFGPEVEVAPDATAQARLVAFFGRDPAWPAIP